MARSFSCGAHAEVSNLGACQTPPPDAGAQTPDAGKPDAGKQDAGPPPDKPDAGTVDAGPTPDWTRLAFGPGQIVLMRTEGNATYRGRFANQERP